MVIKERLELAMRAAGRKQADLKRACGISSAAVAAWFKDDGRPTINIRYDNLKTISDYLDVQIDWLIGKIPMRNSSGKFGHTKENNHTPASSRSVVDALNDDYVYVESYEYWAGRSSKEIRFMSVPREWLARHKLPTASVKSIAMPDDSQAERILAGDLVAINIHWGDTMKNDTLYAMTIGGLYTLRRTAYTATGDIILRCRNSVRFPDEQISKADIVQLDVIGEFVGFLGTTA